MKLKVHNNLRSKVEVNLDRRIASTLARKRPQDGGDIERQDTDARTLDVRQFNGREI